MSYKELQSRTVDGTKEVVLVVDDFDRAAELLLDIGLVQTAYQETKRELWKLGASDITIDTWPWIPTFVEIEAATEDDVQKIALQLDLDWTKAMHGSVESAYCHYYDVTEAEQYSWPSMTLGPVPEWLAKKRK